MSFMMKKIAVAGLAMGTLLAQGAAPVIRDDAPAEEWDLAYPVGNGRLGAMPQGEFPQERILLNEETIWEKRGELLMPTDSAEHLEQIRQLEASGDYAAADKHFEAHLQNKTSPYSYQLAGWLDLAYHGVPQLESTLRRLDLGTGIAGSVHLLADGNEIYQEVFASAPDDVVVVSIRSGKAFGLDVSMAGAKMTGADLVRRGSGSGSGGTQFEVRVRASGDGIVRENGTVISVEKATEVRLYISVATDFNRINPATPLGDGWAAVARESLDALESVPPGEIRSRAIEDHRGYFDRVTINLGESAGSIQGLTTKERLDRIRKGADDDPDLVETYFQLGRYLLIASSRPGCLPANLQGLWNPHLKPPWASDYHLNINLQMNYWLAETTHLGELHRPVFDLLRTFQPTGREMARRLGMKGWCMGHATDVWGSARIMSRRAFWAGSFFGGQWMTFHILEHYRFNRDKAFLEANWDILTASTEFVESWLIPGPGEGELMARPACSPENSFRYRDTSGKWIDAGLSAGNTFDQFMVLQVFSDYLEAASALGRQEDPLSQRVQSLLPRVYRPRIAPDGRLMEWRLPFGEKDPAHRHISHVIGAFPGNQIDLDDDPRMRGAVMKSIEHRLREGGAKTGWSRAWTIGMFARLSDGEQAYENLHAILERSTLDNLWDTHPPFQIDGNFGSTAAIAEMLLHSHNDEIRLLPALPQRWPDGHFKGLRARGDVTVDVKWTQGRLTEAELHCGDRCPDSIRVRAGESTLDLKLSPGASIRLTAEDFLPERRE